MCFGLREFAVSLFEGGQVLQTDRRLGMFVADGFPLNLPRLSAQGFRLHESSQAGVKQAQLIEADSDLRVLGAQNSPADFQRPVRQRNAFVRLPHLPHGAGLQRQQVAVGKFAALFGDRCAPEGRRSRRQGVHR